MNLELVHLPNHVVDGRADGGAFKLRSNGAGLNNLLALGID